MRARMLDLLRACWSQQPIRRLRSVPVRPSRYGVLGDRLYRWQPGNGPRSGTMLAMHI